jgi:hypothetical protein
VTKNEERPWKRRWKDLEGRPRLLGVIAGAIFAVGTFALQMLDEARPPALALALMCIAFGTVWGFFVAKTAQRNLNKPRKSTSK